jgi:hypothetical protein
MSWITIFILFAVLWRMVIGPMLHGYRAAEQEKKTKEKVDYSEYEEL